MEDSHQELASQVRDLTRAVADLQRRLELLENGTRIEQPALAAAEPDTGVPTAQTVVMSFAPGGGAVPLFGWAFLGIAGAYLLRALTESGALPGLLGAGLGIAYAAWWLFLASRRAGEKPLAGAIHGLTAAAILAPMLWEVTVRFHLFTVQVASAVLVLFAIWGLAIGWRRNLTAIAWIGTMAGLVTAGALFRESHDAATWVLSTLAIAAAIEFSACRDHWLSLRWAVAVFADFVAAALVFGVRAPMGLSLGAGVALLAIYAASTVDRTIVRRLPIAWFETLQLVAAFSIAISGALHWKAGPTAGVVCLAAGIACYVAALAILERRNFFVYSTFAAVLMAAGGWLALPDAWLAVLLSALAMAVVWNRRRTLRIHGEAYLLLAVVAAQVFQVASARIIRTGAEVEPGIPLAYVVAALAAVACYVALKDPREAVLPAALVCIGVAGVAASPLGAAPLRTALLTAMAIVVAWCGKRWNRSELVWLGYPLLALAGVKLVMEDFRLGRSITLFVSLIFFGGALVLLPRLLRRTGVVVNDPPAVRTAAQH
jgi:hypothetical protein